jgi:small-conductance mechanosensitive channel
MSKLLLLQAPPNPPRNFDVSVIWRTVEELGESLLARLPYIVIGLLVFFVFLVFARFARRVLHAMGERTKLDVMLADLLGRLASGALVILGVFVAATVVFPSLSPGNLVAGLGITSVAIGFAFKDILQNFFAGILILWRRPFRVGDQIRTNDYEGTVEEINIRSTRLKTYEGERAVLPNGDVYMNAILVRTAYEKRRVRFTVGVGYLDSIEKARATIHHVLKHINGVLSDPGPWVYVAELGPSSVNFNVYFWVESKQVNVLAISDRVATGIKLGLDEAGIDIPYPHTVVLFNETSDMRRGDRPRTAFVGRMNEAGRRETAHASPTEKDTRRSKTDEFSCP